MIDFQNMEKWSLFSPLDQRKYMVRINVLGLMAILSIFHNHTTLLYIIGMTEKISSLSCAPYNSDSTEL